MVTKGQRPHLETVALPLTGAGGLDSPRACFRRFVFVLTTTRWRETRARCPASVASVRDFRWPQPTAVTTRTPHPSAPQGTAHSEYLLGTLGHPPTHAERAGTGLTVGMWEHARLPGGLTRTGRGDALAPFPCPPPTHRTALEALCGLLQPRGRGLWRNAHHGHDQRADGPGATAEERGLRAAALRLSQHV